MPPPPHRRRSPQRRDRRSRSRSRSDFKKFGQRKLSPQRRGRSRSRSPTGKYSKKGDTFKKFDNHSKFGRRSVSPVGRRGRRSVTPPRKTSEPYSSHDKAGPRSGSGSSRRPKESRERRLSPPKNASYIPRSPSPSRTRNRSGFADSGVRGLPENDFKKKRESEPYPPEKDFHRRDTKTKSSSRKHRLSPDSPIKEKRPSGAGTKDRSLSPPPTTRKLLTDRFKTEGSPPIEIEENITIGIHRKLSSNTLISNIVLREFNPLTDFRLTRRNDEGKKPMFDRKEILKFRWDERLEDELLVVEERRVITVAGSSKLETEPVSPVFKRTAKPGSYTPLFTDPRSGGPMRSTDSDRVWRDFDQHHGTLAGRLGNQRKEDSDDDFHSPPRKTQPEVRLDPRPDPRYEHVFRQHRDDLKDDVGTDVKLEKIHRNPNDLRHNLLKKHGGENLERKKLVSSTKSRSGSRVHSSKSPSRKTRRSRSRSRQRVHSRSRSRSRSKGRSFGQGFNKDRDALEKKRDDLTWKQRLDMSKIDGALFSPSKRGRGRGFARGGFNKSPGFDHDNRNEVNYSRGRGFRGSRGRPFRGRGFRGQARGRGGFKDGPKGAWKHDMFDQLEREEDQKPSSTTEK